MTKIGAARRIAGVPRDLGPDEGEVEVGQFGKSMPLGSFVYQGERSEVMIVRMAGLEHSGQSWKSRIARFYPPRGPLDFVLWISGGYLALLFVSAPLLPILDMDGHDRQEEPIRWFLHDVIRTMWCPPGIGLAVIPLFFTIAAVAFVVLQRTPVVRTGRDPVR
jgi:hypothetical protein